MNARALEALERPRAQERRIEGNRTGGKGGKEVAENFTPSSRGNTRDIEASAAVSNVLPIGNVAPVNEAQARA